MPSTTKQDYEQLAYGGNKLSMHLSKATPIISEAVATRRLLASEAGSLCVFDLAAGVVYTLPTPIAGMEFEFSVQVTITSNSAKIITNLGTEFIVGNVLVTGGTTQTVIAAAFNGTTHIACTSSGTTTGGVIGGRIKLTAVSTTLWQISGVLVGSGTVATPAATS